MTQIIHHSTNNTMAEENTQEQKPQIQKPQIGLQDIVFTVEVLKVASRRGAFELNELKSVGELGERLSAFVEANKPEPTDLKDVEETDRSDQGEEVTPEGAD